MKPAISDFKNKSWCEFSDLTLASLHISTEAPYAINMVAVNLASLFTFQRIPESYPLSGTDEADLSGPKRKGELLEGNLQKNLKVERIPSNTQPQPYNGVVLKFPRLFGDSRFLKLPLELKDAFPVLFSMKEDLKTNDPVLLDAFMGAFVGDGVADSVTQQVLLRRALETYINYCKELQRWLRYRSADDQLTFQGFFTNMYWGHNWARRLSILSSIIVLSDFFGRFMSAQEVLGLFLGFLNSPYLDIKGFILKNVDKISLISLNTMNAETPESLFYSVAPNRVVSDLKSSIPEFESSLARTTFEAPARGWGPRMQTGFASRTYYVLANDFGKYERLLDGIDFDPDGSQKVPHKRMFIKNVLVESLREGAGESCVITVANTNSVIYTMTPFGLKQTNDILSHDKNIFTELAQNTNLHTLRLEFLYLTPEALVALKYPYCLEISNCNGFKGVPPMENIHTWIIRDSGLQDLSALAKCETLENMYLENILLKSEDRSALRNVPNLIFDNHYDSSDSDDE